MPTFVFEAMDPSGQEIKDVVEAPTQEDAEATIRKNGYYITKIAAKKGGGKKAKKPKEEEASNKRPRSLALGKVSTKQLTAFTRQLSILQDAGLPILRSLRILEEQAAPGRLKNSLMDVCDEIEGGATLSESMAKCPKTFDRLYVNMIRAGEAGGALEVILQRLADFQERAQALKRKVKGAMVYPVMVVLVAVGILTFIMLKIVPSFVDIFEDFDAELPPPTLILIGLSNWVVGYWWTIPMIPLMIWLGIKLLRKFEPGRRGWDNFMLTAPILGQLVQKNILARGTRTLGTLVASGVPILEGLNITKETTGNWVFEVLFEKVIESIREGESIAKPMQENGKLKFDPVCMLLWAFFMTPLGALFYVLRCNKRIVDALVVNMVDVGEETGELDTMLFKVADTYDEEVSVLTESLTSLMEPILIVGLGGIVGFIVVALFLPLVKLISTLT